MATGRTSKRAARQKRKMILFAFEIIIILVMVVVLYLVMNKTSEGPKMVTLDPKNLAIPTEVIEKTEEGGTMHGYMNIALFGLDAETESQLYKGSRSDSIMIASINLDTGDIKLVSVYRDSYLNIGPYRDKAEYYWKCNTAYAAGGAEQAVRMLNTNLDMDITDFVAVGYKGLSSVIDGLGGVYVDVSQEEVSHLNNYQIGVSSVLKCDYTPVKEAGYQLLNGMQATAYCRIRYTKGDDFRRAERQRDVLTAMMEKAKTSSASSLNQMVTAILPEVETSLGVNEIISVLGSLAGYNGVASDGFPFADGRTGATVGSKGSCVIPDDLEDNVIKLHELLFPEATYKPSRQVSSISDEIDALTAEYRQQ